MFKYFKESFKEFKYVNWPTRQETKTYLKIVVWVLTAFGIYLMIAWGIFNSIVFGIRDMVQPETQVENPLEWFNADDLEVIVDSEDEEDSSDDVTSDEQENTSTSEEDSQENMEDESNEETEENTENQ